MTSFPKTLPPTRPEVSASTDAEPQPRWIEIAKSADHKVISLVLISAAFGSLFLAGLELLLLRIQLSVPENVFLNAVTFDRLLSIYGVTAIFLFALPLWAWSNHSFVTYRAFDTMPEVGIPRFHNAAVVCLQCPPTGACQP